MAVQLNQTDIHLTGTVSGFSDITSPFTVSTWIQYNNWTDGTTKSLVGLYLTGTTAIQIGARGDGNITVWTWGGGVLITSNGAIPLSQTEYVHVVYTFDGGSHRLYINGLLVNITTTSQVPGSPDTIYINGYPTGGTNETGFYAIDDTIYFNRQLTLEEIQTLYNSRGIRDGIYYGVVARYTFGEGLSGTAVATVRDYSLNNNTLSSAGPGTLMTFIDGVVFNDTRPYQ